MKILIISHTEHFLRDGEYVGWGPTVRELDHLAAFFGEVIHVACYSPGKKAPASAQPYRNTNVTFVPIPTYGGNGLKAKLSILTSAPKIIQTVFLKLKGADAFQFRAPTSMGVYMIPLLTLFTRKKGWYKYAGNWVHPNPPLSYRIQCFWLKHLNRRKVTINGNWPGQQEHVLTFENPCLEREDRTWGKRVVSQKKYAPPYTACFVGRLEDAKGVHRILEASDELFDKGITTVHLVGDGPKRIIFERESSNQKVEYVFHGFLDRKRVFQIYEQSHFFLLPSDSEGFPKVVAEAANFGCIPIVSDVSSIGQYVNSTNGFLWDINTSFKSFVANDFITANLRLKGRKSFEDFESFTFQNYCQTLKRTIF